MFFPDMIKIKSSPTTNILVLVASTLATIVSLILVFFLCELGESVANQYKLVDDELYQCDWYSFPIEVQRSLVIFRSYTQQPVLIQGFGNIRCVRNSFKNVSSINRS